MTASYEVRYKMSVAVMAHKKRQQFIPSLLDHLDRTATVVWDEHNDRWDTGRRSMLAYDPDCTHHLVIQDDAVPCRDLVAGLEKALQSIPDPGQTPLCLYTGRIKPFRYLMTEAATRSERDLAAWIRMTQVHWGVGIVFPTGLIDDMVKWCDGQDEIPNYDRRISRWVGTQGLSVYYPHPSLVDHRLSPSLVPGRQSRGRYAYKFIGSNASALDKDWDGPVIHIPSLNRKQWGHPHTPRKRRVHRPSHKEWR